MDVRDGQEVPDVSLWWSWPGPGLLAPGTYRYVHTWKRNLISLQESKQTYFNKCATIALRWFQEWNSIYINSSFSLTNRLLHKTFTCLRYWAHIKSCTVTANSTNNFAQFKWTASLLCGPIWEFCRNSWYFQKQSQKQTALYDNKADQLCYKSLCRIFYVKVSLHSTEISGLHHKKLKSDCYSLYSQCAYISFLSSNDSYRMWSKYPRCLFLWSIFSVMQHLGTLLMKSCRSLL